MDGQTTIINVCGNYHDSTSSLLNRCNIISITINITINISITEILKLVLQISNKTSSKGKVGAHAVAARGCRRSSYVTSAFEPVVDINPLHRDTGPLWHPSFHSLPYLDYPKYPFIYQSVWEDEQLGELCTVCLRPRSNSGQRIRSQAC